MFCTQCGSKTEDDSVFCPFCGAKTEIENMSEQEIKTVQLQKEQCIEKDRENKKEFIQRQRENKKQEEQEKSQEKTSVKRADNTNNKKQKVKLTEKKTVTSGMQKFSNHIPKRIIWMVLPIMLLLAVIVVGCFWLFGKTDSKLNEEDVLYMASEGNLYKDKKNKFQGNIKNSEGYQQLVWEDYEKGNYYYIDEEDVLYYVSNFGKQSEIVEKNVSGISQFSNLTDSKESRMPIILQYTKNSGKNADTTGQYYCVRGIGKIKIRNLSSVPVFSPNEKYMAYTKSDLGEFQLYVADIASGEEKKIKTCDVTVTIVGVEDNKKIIYSLYDGDKEKSALYQIDSETGESQKMAESFYSYAILEEKSGNMLTVDGNGDLRYGNLNNPDDFEKIASELTGIQVLEEGDTLISELYQRASRIVSELGSIVYFKENACYYMDLKKDGEPAKVLSGDNMNSYNVQISENRSRIFGIIDGGLYGVQKKKNGWSDKEKIASDVTWYEIAGDGKSVIFVKDGNLYYWNEKENIKLADDVRYSTEYVGRIQSGVSYYIKRIESGVLYVDIDDTLYYKPFSEKKQKIKLGTDVWDYVKYDDAIYYRTEDKTVYRIDLDGDNKELIMNDVDNFITYRNEKAD